MIKYFFIKIKQNQKRGKYNCNIGEITKFQERQSDDDDYKNNRSKKGEFIIFFRDVFWSLNSLAYQVYRKNESKDYQS